MFGGPGFESERVSDFFILSVAFFLLCYPGEVLEVDSGLPSLVCIYMHIINMQ